MLHIQYLTLQAYRQPTIKYRQNVVLRGRQDGRYTITHYTLHISTCMVAIENKVLQYDQSDVSVPYHLGMFERAVTRSTYIRLHRNQYRTYFFYLLSTSPFIIKHVTNRCTNSKNIIMSKITDNIDNETPQTDNINAVALFF